MAASLATGAVGPAINDGVAGVKSALTGEKRGIDVEKVQARAALGDPRPELGLG